MSSNFAVLIVAIRLRKIPDGALRLIVAAAAQNGGARVLIHEFVGPLPDVAYQIHYAERAGPCGCALHGPDRALCGLCLAQARRWRFQSLPQG